MLAKILTIIFIFVLVFILFNLDKIEINNIKNKKNDKYHLIVNNSKSERIIDECLKKTAAQNKFKALNIRARKNKNLDYYSISLFRGC